MNQSQKSSIGQESLTIRVVGPDGKRSSISQSMWSVFFDELRRLGVEIIADDSGSEVVALIVFDFGKVVPVKVGSKSSVTRRILFAWEPVVVVPSMYRRRVLDSYYAVYSPSPLRLPVPGTRVHRLAMYLTESRGITWLPASEQFSAGCFIVANKVSFVKAQNYTLRREVILACKRRAVPLHLYGAGWEKFPTRRIGRALLRSCFALRALDFSGVSSLEARREAHGRADDKFLLASRYAVAVVIENCSDYVSEKLFDAVDSGCVVLYVGPPLETFGLSGAAYECPGDAGDVAFELERLVSLSPSEREAIRRRQAQVVEEVRKHRRSVIREMAESLRADLLHRSDIAVADGQ